jgi:S-DNA-T family DNA segregation ATPase FtsK/SpoIIIE
MASVKKLSFTQIMQQALKRFGQDLLGLLLIAIAVVSILGFLGVTSGSLIDFFTAQVTRGFGWGSYVLMALLANIGFLILLRHIERFPHINIQRILSLELALFSLLPFLSILGGLSIERAERGLDGGVIGWGLARLLRNVIGLPFTSLFYFAILAVFILSGLGLWRPLLRKLDKYFENVINRASPSFLSSNIKRTEESAVVEDKHNENHEVLESRKLPLSPAFKVLPTFDLLMDPQKNVSDEAYIHSKAIQIEKTMEEFGVPARVAGYRVGPTVIQYAVEPGFVEKVNEEGDLVRKKVRVSQISTLNRDLTLALAVDRLRIEAPIPNHSYVGIEIPNQSSTLVRMKSILQSDEFRREKSALKLALGLDVSGNPVIADLARMPHLLVAGTTGSGKSVCLTSLITCLVFNNAPEDLKIAILDPKMVELVRFNGLPHLLGKVETQLDRMLGILAWAIKEMENRYRLLESVNARDLDAYNEKMLRRGHGKLPKVVIFIDELADLMLTAGDQTETYLVRLAQMARATGIHLVVATQRPSTDIVTGLIKANFPARIAFLVASSVDSRVILDANGAETLMGKGDLLFLDPEATGLQRAQSVIVDDREIEKIIAYWQIKEDKTETSTAAPWEDIIPNIGGDSDELIDRAIDLILKEGKASTSWLQRKLRIGFPRAARLMDELEQRGIVGPNETGGREREIMVDHPDGDIEDEQERNY